MNENNEKRAPVQENGICIGTVSWPEHESVHRAYAAITKTHSLSAERIAERGGFSVSEFKLFVGHAPTTLRAVSS